MMMHDQTSHQRRNKRKTFEPKKLLSSPVKRQRIDLGGLSGSDEDEGTMDESGVSEAHHSRPRLGSTGSSGERSPPASTAQLSPASRSPSPVTNSPYPLAPKMRYKMFKQEMRYDKNDEGECNNKKSAHKSSPFRPWDRDTASSVAPPSPAPSVTPPKSLITPPAVAGITAESLGGLLSAFYPKLLLPPLASSASALGLQAPSLGASAPTSPLLLPTPPPVQDEPLSLVKHKRDKDEQDQDEDLKPILDQEETSSRSKRPSSKNGGKQRNYKNMTRERRVEANARERQRVHTITAAFDTLQAAIPTHPSRLSEDGLHVREDNEGATKLNSNQKLSKLSIIKIATSYIMVLSRMAGYDYTIDKSAPSVEDCIKKCSELVEAESKTRKSSSRTT